MKPWHLYNAVSSSGPLWVNGEVLAHVTVRSVEQPSSTRYSGKVILPPDAVMPQLRVFIVQPVLEQ